MTKGLRKTWKLAEASIDIPEDPEENHRGEPQQKGHIREEGRVEGTTRVEETRIIRIGKEQNSKGKSLKKS